MTTAVAPQQQQQPHLTLEIAGQSLAAREAARLSPWYNIEWSPATLGMVEDQVRQLFGMTAILSREIGERLLWVQEGLKVNGGESFNAWLRRNELPRRTAQIHMAFAQRCRTSRIGELPLSIGKLRALMDSLTDGDIDELVERGAIGDLTMDAVDQLSATELREQLRQERQKTSEMSETIEKGEEQLIRLQVELGKRPQQLQMDFMARAERLICEGQSLIDTFEGCETGEEICRRAGSPLVARQIMHRVEQIGSRLLHIARQIQPEGTVVEIDPLALTRSAPVRGSQTSPVAGRRS